MTPRPGAMNHSDSGAAFVPWEEWGNLPDTPIENETAP